MTYKSGDIVTHNLRPNHFFKVMRQEVILGMDVITAISCSTGQMYRFHIRNVTLAKNYIVKQILDDL